MNDKSNTSFQVGEKIYNIHQILGDMQFTVNHDSFSIADYSTSLGMKWKEEQLKSVFKFNDTETELVQNLPLIFAHNYFYSSEFNSIRIHADIDDQFGVLKMDDYFIHPSYIPERDLLKRESIIQNDNETSAIKVRKSGQFQHFLPHDYISGNLFENANRIVITGSPGVGKSTYARWLCYKWAKTEINMSAILIYMNLRDMNFSTKNSIISYILDEYFKGNAVDEKILINILSLLNQNFFFLLDGYDELDAKAHDKLKKDLYRLSTDSRYILLSRPYGLLQTFGFNWQAAFQIDGFNHSNIENYIHKFLLINHQVNKSKKELMDIIQNNSVLYDYAHNPLMLSFIVYIYLKSNKPDENLTKIQSQYDLQNEVFRWINTYEKNKQTYIENDYLLKQSEEFSYQLQINKTHQYQSNEEPDNYSNVLLYLSRIGIGNTRKVQSGNPIFNFNTITFREFLAARYLRNTITHKAFLYLSEEIYFWNFCRMLIGAIATNKQKNELDDILNTFKQEFQETQKAYYRYMYFTLLSETNVEFVKQNIHEQAINELYQFFKMSYHDEKWIYIFSEAVVRIFSKLSYHSKNFFRKLIIEDIKQFIEAESVKSDDPNLDDAIIHVINQLHLYHDIEFIEQMLCYYYDFAQKVSAPDFTEKYYGLVIYFLEWFSQVPKQKADLLQNELKQVVEKTSSFFVEERTKVALLYENFDNAVNNLNSAASELDKTDEEQMLPILQKLCSAIFLVGHLYNKNNENKQLRLVEKLKHLSLKLEKELEDEFRFEDFDYNSLVNLSVQGMAAMNVPELYDSILSLIVATEPAYLFLRIPNNNAFLSYLKQLINSTTENFDDEVFRKLLFAIRDTENARNYFALFRDNFFDMMNIYVQKNLVAFNTIEGLYTKTTLENDKQYLEYIKITTRFNRITELLDSDGEIFSYDKKFLIDKMLENDYDEILFFRHYLIPRLLADDFNYFQSSYWEMLLSYSDNFYEIVKLLSILDNEGAYLYESNLPYLYKIHLKIAQIFNTISDENIQEYAQFFIKIIANILVMLKKTENEEYISKFIPLTGKLLLHPQLINSFKDPNGIGSYAGSHLIAYIIQYYFTKSNTFDLNIDYDAYTENHKRERMQLLYTMINLFTKNDKLDLQELMTLKSNIGDGFTTRIQQYLQYNSELLREFSVKEFKSLIKIQNNMKLTKEQFKELQDILMDIYRTPDEMTNFVRVTLNENRHDFAGGDDLKPITSKLINWAEAKGRLKELVDGLKDDNPDNERVTHFKLTVIKSSGKNTEQGGRTINQHGQKSLYFEKNEGDITIN